MSRILFFWILKQTNLQFLEGGVCTSEARVDGKVIIVTGSNTGIGKETVKELVKRGGKVYMACRSLDRANAAADDILKLTGVSRDQVLVMKLDLSSLDSVREFAKNFKARESRLDILINNAGIMALNERMLTSDGHELQFGTNHLGHFLLTNLLLDLLVSSAPSRIVTVSSSAHSMYPAMEFDDINLEQNYSPWRAYAQSKLANVMFSRELGKKLNGTGVTTYSLHPGAIYTELQKHSFMLSNPVSRMIISPFFKSVPQGAQTQICCAIDESLASKSGKFYSDCVEKSPLAAAEVDEDCKRLWDISEEMVKLQPKEMPKVFS